MCIRDSIRGSVDQQWAPSPELDKDCSGIHNPRTAHWAPSPGLEKRLGRSFDRAHQRDADHPRTAGDADSPRTAQPAKLPLGLSISDLVHMGADPRTAQQDSQHPFGTAAIPLWSLAFTFSDYHQTDDDFERLSQLTVSRPEGRLWHDNRGTCNGLHPLSFPEFHSDGDTQPTQLMVRIVQQNLQAQSMMLQ